MAVHSSSCQTGSARGESAPKRLCQIYREIVALRARIAEVRGRITELDTAYEQEVNRRSPFAKSTGRMLTAAYDEHLAASNQLAEQEALYQMVLAEPDTPAIIGWDCGNCGRSHYIDLKEPDDLCPCGHWYCGLEVEVHVHAGYDSEGNEIVFRKLAQHCPVRWETAAW